MLAALQSTEDGRFALRFERRFAHPPEQVWQAITDPAQLSSWFPATVEFDLTPGAKLRFGPTAEQKERFGSTDDQATFGEVTEVDPPRLLEYTWNEEILRWEVSGDEDGGSRLVFIHTFDDRDAGAPLGAGWHAGLDVVEAQLNGETIEGSPMDRAMAYNDEYAEAFA